MTQTKSVARPVEPGIPRHVWRIAVVVVAGAFMSTLDTSVVNVGLARMSTGLGASLGTAQWVSSGYLLALAAAMPPVGWLSRRFSARSIWLASLAAFTLASALCAVAGSLGELIGLRVLQGVAGGVLVPAGQIMLARAAGPSRMGRVMSTVGIAVVLAPVIGPVVGGLLIELSWRWLFLINVPFGLAGLLAGRRILPADGERPSAGRLDVAGLVLAAGGLAVLTYGITEASRRGSVAPAPVALALASGAAALVLFVLRSRATEAPLVQLGVWRNPAFTSSAIVAFFGGAALFGGLVLVPLYLEVLRGQGTVATGLVLIGQGAGAAITMPLSGRLTDRFGGGVVSVAGLLLSALATLPLLTVTAHTGLPAIVAITTARGMGVGLAIMPAVAAAYSAIDRAQIPDATPQLNAVQRIGGSIGTAVLVVAVQRGIGRPAHAFQNSFGLLLATTVLALIPAVGLSVVLRRTRRLTDGSTGGG